MPSFIGLALMIPEISKGVPKDPPGPLNGKKSLAGLSRAETTSCLTIFCACVCYIKDTDNVLRPLLHVRAIISLNFGHFTLPTHKNR